MNYLNKIKALFSALHGDEIMLNAMVQQLDYFTKYVNSVVDYVIKGEMLRESGASFDQLRAGLERLDVSRKLCHDGAISAVNMINRTCNMYDVEVLTDVDTTDRHAVADFVGNFILEIYKGEIDGNGMDQAVAEANGVPYDRIESVKDKFEA